MTRKYFAILSLLCTSMLSAFGQRTTVTTSIKGLEQNDTLTLSWGANNKSMNPQIKKVGAKVETSFIVPLNEPRLLQLSVKGYTGYYELLASPGENINLSGRVKKSDNGKHIEISFKKLNVQGAALQEKYQNAIQSYEHYQDSLDNTVFNEYRDVIKHIEKAKANGNEEDIAKMYQTLHGQSYIDKVMNIYEQQKIHLKTFVNSYRDSFMGPLLLLRLEGRLTPEYRSLYDKMSDEAKASYYGREVKDEVYPPTLLNENAPAVNVTDTADVEQVISFANNNGKYTLLYFWASWCEPCRKEIPNLKLLYETYHKKGLDVIGISADYDRDLWLECMSEVGGPWANYLDYNRQATSEYKVQFIPSIFIIDNKGKIIAEKLRGKFLSDYINSLFETK